MDKEKMYKAVSTTAAAVEALAKPVTKHQHKLMLEGSIQFYSNIYSGLDTADHGTGQKFS